MKSPEFWWKSSISVYALILWPFSFIYGLLTGLRMQKKGTRVDIPVFCIGNFILGGAGKTPTALTLCRALEEQGYRCAFLSRGYGGNLSGPVLVERTIHKAIDVGDEPLLLSGHAMTVVSKDRVAGARLCEQLGADLIIMDDGMQNPSLHKDFTLAIWDGNRGCGNNMCFPAGPLRAPLKQQIKVTDAVLVVKPQGIKGETYTDITKCPQFRFMPEFSGKLIPDEKICLSLKGRKLLAFAGIGYPEKFYDTLLSCGAELIKTYNFNDHHPYSLQELMLLVQKAQQLDCEIFTTTKDYVRICNVLSDSEKLKLFQVLPVTLICDQKEKLLDMIHKKFIEKENNNPFLKNKMKIEGNC